MMSLSIYILCFCIELDFCLISIILIVENKEDLVGRICTKMYILGCKRKQHFLAETGVLCSFQEILQPLGNFQNFLKVKNRPSIRF